MMWTKDFWKATAERAVRLAAGSMLTVLIVGDGMLDAFSADWRNVISIGLGGAICAVLFALAGNAVSGNGPAFSKTEVVDPNGAAPPPPAR